LRRYLKRAQQTTIVSTCQPILFYLPIDRSSKGDTDKLSEPSV
jgi:hypothetical protein